MGTAQPTIFEMLFFFNFLPVLLASLQITYVLYCYHRIIIFFFYITRGGNNYVSKKDNQLVFAGPMEYYHTSSFNFCNIF